MGYRETARLPLIGAKGNNSGLYFDLYSAAAKKLNMKLKIIREPKKRILKQIAEGSIDFYPGFTFNTKRTLNVFFLKNGLDGSEVAMTLDTQEDINSFEELKKLRILTALGGPRSEILSKFSNIHTRSIPSLSIKKAIELIRLKRHDVYIYNRNSVEYYIAQNKIKDIKLHHNCCGGDKPMYLGFSKKSSYVNEILNPNYDKNKKTTLANLPTILTKESLAFKLEQTLEQMKKSGEIRKIFNKYYK
mgnify:CR=1 FL=1